MVSVYVADPTLHAPLRAAGARYAWSTPKQPLTKAGRWLAHARAEAPDEATS